jgi:FkbM family methyltransferase
LTSTLRRFLNVLPRQLRRQKLLVMLYRAKHVQTTQVLECKQGARAWVDLRDAESRATYLSQSFWPEFHPMVAAFLRDGGDFFDVGANFGLVTLGVLPLVCNMGLGFHLFEANPNIIPLLARSARLWPNERITVNHCCVSDLAGVSRLSLPDRCWGHAFIGECGDAVPNLVLDEYISKKGIEHISFMKMDVEGWELHALAGARESLSAGKVRAAFIEVAPEALRRAGAHADKLLQFLREMGFDLYFCGMWDTPDPHSLVWVRVPVNGTSLRFAAATPLPSTYVSGDVLVVHRSNPLSRTIREALAA